ncbi:hypothetical protein F4803DRAFT_537331 [Xylaria telfairii]|nr:hypothetical protein F4803DRAFT_537331 [Xylaria telfairii]
MSVSGSQVGDCDVAGLFSTIVAYLGRVKVNKHFSEDVGKHFREDPLPYYLKLGVLRLRLCRWYDRITKVDGVDSSSFWADLNSIRLLSGEGDAQSADTSSSDKWMLSGMDFLSQKHHPHNVHNTKRTTLNGRALNSLIAQVLSATEKLEAYSPPNQAGDVKERLDQMRYNDAKYIRGQLEASQRGLQCLEENAMHVDPDFARLVALPKGHIYVDTSIDKGGLAVVGDEIGAGWGGGMIGNGSLYERTRVSEHGVAVIGNRYGGESIFAGMKTGRGR